MNITRIISLLVVCIFLMTSLVSITQGMVSPDCEIAITCNKTKINPGDKFELNIYMVGVGENNFSFLSAISDNYTTLKELYYLGSPVFTGNFNYILGHFSSPSYLPNNSAKIWATFGWDGIPFKIKVETNDSIPAGNHEITVSYFYRDNESNWHHSSKIYTFYVNTPEEQYAWIYYFLGSILVPFVTTLIAVVAAFLIAKKYEGEGGKMKKNIYLLFLLFVGLYLIIDGLGSILIYHTQPFFPDHVMRIIRSVLGTIIAYIGFNLYTKK